MKEMQRARHGEREGAERPFSFWGRHPPRTLVCSPVWKLLKPCHLGVLSRFHYAGMMDQIIGHLLLNSVSSSSPHPGSWRLD